MVQPLHIAAIAMRAVSEDASSKTILFDILIFFSILYINYQGKIIVKE